MKYLQEIVKIVNSKRVRNVQILDRKADRTSILFKFFKGLSSGKFESDEEAALFLLNTGKDTENYRKLKSNLRKRLYNNLFYLAVADSQGSSYPEVHYYCTRNMVLIKLMSTRGSRKTAEQLARKTLNLSLKYTFTDIAIYCARLIREMSFVNGKIPVFKKMNSLLESLCSTQEAEYIAESYRQKMLIGFTRSVALKKEINPIAAVFLKKIKPLTEKHRSFQLHSNFYYGWMSLHLHKSDYAGALRVLNRQSKFLTDHPEFIHSEEIGRLSLKKLYCYLHLGDVKKGEREAQTCMEMFKKRSANYFIFLEYYVLMNLRAGNYLKAQKIITGVVQDTKFSDIPAPQQEKWKIFNAYVHYINHLQLRKSTKFRLSRFLNEVPIYNRDKKGYNVAILIVQVLFLLDSKQFDRIMDLSYSLKIYCSRWLNKDDDYRSNCFIKMLLIMERESFDPACTRKYTLKYLAKLQGAHYEHKEIGDLEIVPYETLWAMILKKLDESATKKVRNKKPAKKPVSRIRSGVAAKAV